MKSIERGDSLLLSLFLERRRRRYQVLFYKKYQHLQVKQKNFKEFLTNPNSNEPPTTNYSINNTLCETEKKFVQRGGGVPLKRRRRNKKPWNHLPGFPRYSLQFPTLNLWQGSINQQKMEGEKGRKRGGTRIRRRVLLYPYSKRSKACLFYVTCPNEVWDKTVHQFLKMDEITPSHLMIQMSNACLTIWINGIVQMWHNSLVNDGWRGKREKRNPVLLSLPLRWLPLILKNSRIARKHSSVKGINMYCEFCRNKNPLKYTVQ